MHRTNLRFKVFITLSAMFFLSLNGMVMAYSPMFINFSDIPHMNSGSISASVYFDALEGIMSGYPNGTFNPNGYVTRAEMAAVVVNLAGDNNEAKQQANIKPNFIDAASIPSWAWGDVNVAVALGAIHGYPDGTFRPNSNVSEVEAVVMMVNLLKDSWYISHVQQVHGYSWPKEYTYAANTLNLVLSGWVPNAPATRGWIAELADNAAILTDCNVNSSEYISYFAGQSIIMTQPICQGIFQLNYANYRKPAEYNGTVVAVKPGSIIIRPQNNIEYFGENNSTITFALSNTIAYQGDGYWCGESGETKMMASADLANTCLSKGFRVMVVQGPNGLVNTVTNMGPSPGIYTEVCAKYPNSQACTSNAQGYPANNSSPTSPTTPSTSSSTAPPSDNSCPPPLSGTTNNTQNRIVLTVELTGPNGTSQPIKAVLDTGGGNGAFPNGLMQQLGYQPISQGTASGVGGGQQEAYLYEIPYPSVLDNGKWVSLGQGDITTVGIVGYSKSGLPALISPNMLRGGVSLQLSGSSWTLTFPCSSQ